MGQEEGAGWHCSLWDGAANEQGLYSVCVFVSVTSL